MFLNLNIFIFVLLYVSYCVSLHNVNNNYISSYSNKKSNTVQFLSKYQFNNDDYIFHETSKIHLYYFTKYNFTEQPVYPHYKSYYSPIKNSIIQNFVFSNPQFRKVCVSYFKSDDKQMFKSVWYPSYDYDCPIFSVDLVKDVSNNSFCFINLVEMYKNVQYYNNYIAPFVKMKKFYPEIPKHSSNYLYQYDNFLSKAMLYRNIYDDNDFSITVNTILQCYLSVYLKKFIKKPVNKIYLQEKHTEYNNFVLNKEMTFFTKYFGDDCILHMNKGSHGL